MSFIKEHIQIKKETYTEMIKKDTIEQKKQAEIKSEMIALDTDSFYLMPKCD